MGRKRVRGKRWGSRIIDLDILFFDMEIIDKRNLKVPHPEIPNRRFVLVPAERAGTSADPPRAQCIGVGAAGDGQGREEDPPDGGSMSGGRRAASTPAVLA